MQTLFLTNQTLSLKTKFVIDINVQINGYIIFQTSVQDSCFPFVTKIYSSLDLLLKNLPIMDVFKVNLKLKYKSKKVKHFSSGISKYANALHTQMRVGQSYLNAHGSKTNLKENDLCLCHRSTLDKPCAFGPNVLVSRHI